MTDEVEIVLAPDGAQDAGAAEAASGLAADVAAEFGPKDERALALVAREGRGMLAGGLVGSTHWGWCYVRQLWVAPAWRGRGIGQRLLEGAEAEARARGCLGLYLDTFSPRAVRFYERNGFGLVGVVADFPPGHRRTYLAKRLDGPGA